MNRSAVHPHQVVHDRQPEAETAMRARRGAVALAEAFEDVRQKFRIDAAARVGDDDLDEPGIAGSCRDVHATARRREPHGIREKVPDDLLQPS